MPSATPETDLLRIDDQLTPDERLVRDTVHEFTADRIEPHIADWFEAGTRAPGPDAGARQAGPARHAPDRVTAVPGSARSPMG